VPAALHAVSGRAAKLTADVGAAWPGLHQRSDRVTDEQALQAHRLGSNCNVLQQI